MFKCLRIKHWRICSSVKAMCLTAFSFTFCFILLLNVMVHQLAVSSESSDLETKEYSGNQLMEPKTQNSDDSKIEASKKQKATNEKVLNIKVNKANDHQQISETVNGNNVEFQPKDSNSVKKLQPLSIQDESISDKNMDRMPETKNGEEETKYVYDSDKDRNLKAKDKNYISNDVVYDNCFQKKDSSRTMTIHEGPLHGPAVKPSPSKKQTKSQMVDGIYWSEKAEALVPKGMSKKEVIKWIRTVRYGKIKNLQPPSWERCGRPKNGFIVMKNGIELCARYQHPNDKFILGEVLSFYLSLMLKLDNVPAVVLSEVNSASLQWQGTDPSQLEWEQHQYVALIQWIEDINHYGESHVEIPPILFEMYKTGNSLDCYILNKQQLPPEEISNIIQWGSMVIFDYLTGNYDRVASMQDGAEEQNSQSVIQELIRNLRKSSKTGKFWLIDNESGLLDAYELMYRRFENGEKFVRFHKEMLQTLCIFERPLVEALKNLHNNSKPHEQLEEFTRKYEPLYDKVPKDPDNLESLFYTMFSKRISDVIGWIQHCDSRTKR